MILDARAAALLREKTHLRQIRTFGVDAIAVFEGRANEVVIVTAMPDDADNLASSIRERLQVRRPVRFVTIFENQQQALTESDPTAVVDRVVRAGHSLTPEETSAVPFAGGWVLVLSLEDGTLSCDIHTDKPQDSLAAEVMALAIPNFRYVGIQMAGRWARGQEGDTAEEILACIRDQQDEGWMPLDEFPQALARALADALRYVGIWGQGDFPFEGLPDAMTLERSKGLHRTELVRIEVQGAVVTIDLSPSKVAKTT